MEKISKKIIDAENNLTEQRLLGLLGSLPTT